MGCVYRDEVAAYGEGAKSKPLSYLTSAQKISSVNEFQSKMYSKLKSTKPKEKPAISGNKGSEAK